MTHKTTLVWNLCKGSLEYYDKITHPYYSFEIEWQTDLNWKWPHNKHVWKDHPPPTTAMTQENVLSLMIVKSNNMIPINVTHLLPAENNQLDFRSLQWVRGRFQLLKSNAQKATRLARTDIALRSTWVVLCTQDPDLIEKWLKRWSIIMTEDSMLHPVFAYLFFFQVAITRGWVLNDYAKFVILRGIESLCAKNVAADWRCDFKSGEASDNSSSITNTSNSSFRQLILQSIIWRSNYGGMKGDLGLLYDVWKTWKERFENAPQTIPQRWIEWETTNEWLSLEKPPTLDRWQFDSKDQLLTAVDMHCSSILVILMEKFDIPENELTTLSSLIWDRRSSIRIRPCTCGQHANDETKASDKQLIQSNDPEWWSKIVKYIDALCTNEWYQPTYVKVSDDEGACKKTRAEILESQVRNLSKRRNNNNDDGVLVPTNIAKKPKPMINTSAKIPVIKNNKSLMSFFTPNNSNNNGVTKTKVIKLCKKDPVQYDIYAGRELKTNDWQLEGSEFANFFVVSSHFPIEFAVECYWCWLMEKDFDYRYLGFSNNEEIQQLIENRPAYIPEPKIVREHALEKLKGKTIACWCKNQGDYLLLCHVDILIYQVDSKLSLALKQLLSKRNLL